MKFTGISLALGVFALAGCSTSRSFVPYGVNLSTTAHVVSEFDLQSASSDGRRFYVRGVDGKHTTDRVVQAPTDVYLLPGKHAIDLEYQHAGMSAESHLFVTVKAGAEYVVHHEVLGYSVKVWITEGEAGPTVSEKRS
ncbi:hypothetical protein [Dyella humicola]|uniref:hypothetical protein n=1 Tax=Dyella humicola TaxID=2992126 RepID=UPI00225A6024|nr:hypothetical protein [Dyella humicola]